MYTLMLDSLVADKIRNNDPFMIREVSETEYGFQALRELNLLFATEPEAYAAAKQLYFQRRYAAKCDPKGTYENFFKDGFICTGPVNADSDVSNPFRFKTERDAEEALQSIGEYNFVKYVLNLRDTKFYAPMYV